MIRLVITNQRGGDTKTTTTLSLARYLADKGKKVLVVDTDPQGSIAVVLGLKAQDKSLHNFLIKDYNFKECLVSPHENIDVLPSNRQTVETEAVLMGHTARELTFRNVFPRVDGAYDAVLIDVAPSISLLQTCAMLYAQNMLPPRTPGFGESNCAVQPLAVPLRSKSCKRASRRSCFRPDPLSQVFEDEFLGRVPLAVSALGQFR